MKSVDPGILDKSVCFSFTPSDLAKKLYFHPIWCGHYFCTSNYQMKRDYYPPLLVAFIREGKFHVEYEGLVFDADKGDVILLDCSKPHFYRAYDGLEFVYLHFDGSNSHELVEFIINTYGPHIRNHNNLLVGNYLYNMISFYEQDGIESLFESSMRIYKLLQLLSEKDSSHQEEDTVIEETIRYIRNNVGKQITLNELSNVAALSPYYFSRCFKDATGLSPINYVIHTRIDRAKILLSRSNKSVEEIAFEVGYSSSTSLINVFIQKTGMSPKQYRLSSLPTPSDD